MTTPPEMQDTVFLSRVMCPALKEPNAARMAPEAMTPMSLVSLPENLFCTFSILSALTVAKTIQPSAPRIMVHTALAKAMPVMGSLPRVTPTACVPKPAAIISYMAEPMNDSRIHAMGPPRETSRAIIALSTTREGPKAVMALLLHRSSARGSGPFQGSWSRTFC